MVRTWLLSKRRFYFLFFGWIFYFLDVDTNAESSLKCKSCSLGKYQNMIQSKCHMLLIRFIIWYEFSVYETKLPSIITLFNKISLPSFISFLLWCYAVSGCPMFFYPSCHVGTSSNVRQSTGVWQEDLKWFTRILEILNQISWCVRMIQCHSTVQYSSICVRHIL